LSIILVQPIIWLWWLYSHTRTSNCHSN